VPSDHATLPPSSQSRATSAPSMSKGRSPSDHAILVAELQDDLYAHDIMPPPTSATWTEVELRQFFESGGAWQPASATSFSSPTVTPAPQARAATRAKKQPEQPAVDEAATAAAKRARQYDRSARAGGAVYGLPPSDPVLVECGASQANVQPPREEVVEEWQAMPSGGFERMIVC
jgi:hypothetical protein